MKDQSQRTPAVNGSTPIGYGRPATANPGTAQVAPANPSPSAQGVGNPSFPSQPTGQWQPGDPGAPRTATDPATDPNAGERNASLGATPMPKPNPIGSTTQPTQAPTSNPMLDAYLHPQATQSDPSQPTPAPQYGQAMPTGLAPWQISAMQQGGSPASVNANAAQAASVLPPQQRQTDIGGNSTAQGAAPGTMGNEWGSLISSLDLSKMPAMGAQAQDAAYKNASGYLDPQWANQQHAMETQLANQGVMQNSEAWNKAMDDFGRQREFAYGQARSAAFNQGLAAQNQSFGQTLSQAQLANSAQGQLAGQGLTQRQIEEALQAAQIQGNATVGAASASANASMSNIQAQLAAADRQNHFNNDLTLRNQGINELLLRQQNPITTANSLNQGTGVTQPNFTTTPNSSVNPTDIASLINQAYQGQLTGYNAQTGAANSGNSAWASILAAIICDRRMKKNIRFIGMHTAGFPLYEFDYVWGEHAVGPMADEVERILPHAVLTLPSGVKAVNMAGV